ncbi:MAG: ice-binding family protein, partial [Ignavibacteria bacterium]|nr:ice-binding family protein [Ignavibacteria bacterium]
ASDVWIFQIAQGLTLANGAIVTLGGDAQASNIFWQVAGQVTIGTTAAMKGIILCQTLIALQTGGTLTGRALAQSEVTLDANSIISPTGITGVELEDGLAPQEFTLFQNYPNPFNPSTTINFSLTVDSKVSLKIFDVLGQEVATLINGQLAAGSQKVSFNASSLNSGVYFYRIDAAGIDGQKFSSTKKMILMK